MKYWCVGSISSLTIYIYTYILYNCICIILQCVSTHTLYIYTISTHTFYIIAYASYYSVYLDIHCISTHTFYIIAYASYCSVCLHMHCTSTHTYPRCLLPHGSQDIWHCTLATPLQMYACNTYMYIMNYK